MKSVVTGIVTGATEVLLYCLKPCEMFLSFLGTLAKLQKVTVSFVMSICLSIRLSEWNIWAPTGWFFMKFEDFLEVCQ